MSEAAVISIPRRSERIASSFTKTKVQTMLSLSIRRRAATRVLGLLIVCAALGTRPAGAQVRSITSERPVTITFDNAVGTPVEVYWIDFEGNEQRYGTLEPGITWEQGTYETHAWRFKKDGRVLGVYVANAEPRQYSTVYDVARKPLGPADFSPDREEPGLQVFKDGFSLPYRRPITVWSTEEVYDLNASQTFLLSFDALIGDEGQELILAFSHNRVPWGAPGPDALTIRVSPGDQDFWFRTGFYGNWLDTELYYEPSERIVRAGQTQRYTVALTDASVTVAVDGRVMVRASLEGAAFERKGHVGFVVFGNDELAHTRIAYRNVTVSRPPTLAMAGGLTGDAGANRGDAGANRDFGTPTDTNTSEAAEAGRYFALVIAVEKYAGATINDLTFPVQDAQNVIRALTENYTFDPQNVIFLRDPVKAEITNALDRLVDQVKPNDNLLIFYAGHGYWDERMKQGFWLPADAEQGFRANWLSNGTIRDYINGIRTRHTLLISDACFSGGIFKTREAFTGADRAVEELFRIPSRKAMTSGTLNVVPDESVFVRYLIKTLRENRAPFLTSRKLFGALREPVINNSPLSQVPQFGVVHNTGDEGGEFIFVHKR